MKPQFNGVIQRKLALLDSQVGKLENSLKDVPKEKFLDDWVLRSAAERALQVAAEIMIDVAERVIALNGAGPAATSRDAIKKLVSLKVLASDEPYSKAVGLRNMIVHRYEEIDPSLLYNLATTRLSDFRKFREEIDRAAST